MWDTFHDAKGRRPLPRAGDTLRKAKLTAASPWRGVAKRRETGVTFVSSVLGRGLGTRWASGQLGGQPRQRSTAGACHTWLCRDPGSSFSLPGRWKWAVSGQSLLVPPETPQEL